MVPGGEVRCVVMPRVRGVGLQYGRSYPRRQLLRNFALFLR